VTAYFPGLAISSSSGQYAEWFGESNPAPLWMKGFLEQN